MPGPAPWDWLRGDGEMARRIRRHEWSATPLGAVEHWSIALRTALRMILEHPLPMVLVWGPELITLYNDAYRPLLGDKPEALGRPFLEVWKEASDIIAPQIAQVFAGDSLHFENARFLLERKGRPAEAFFDYSYSPVRDEAGAVVGVLNTAVETTSAVVAERERAKAVVALRESEQRYRLFFDAVDAGFCTFEMIFDDGGEPIDFRYIDTNAGFEKQTGRRPLPGQTMREVFPEADQMWLDLYAEVARTGAAQRFIDYVGGLDRWYEVYVFPIGEPGRNRLGALFTDVTERKLAEEALRRRQERQTFLLSFSDALRVEPDADAVANRAIRMLSDQMELDRCYITSFRLDDDRSDVTHQLGNDRVPPLPDTFRLSDYPEALRVMFDRTLVIEDELEREGLSEAEKRNSRKLGMRALVAPTLRNGHNRPLWAMVAVSATPRRWTRGEIALVEEAAERTWAAMERARGETALRESEGRLKRVLETRAVGVLFFNEDGVLIGANDAFLSMTGYTREQVERHELDWRGMSPPEFLPTSEKELKKLRKTGHLGPYEKEFFLADGSRSWMLFAARDLGDGTIVEYVIDITGQRSAQSALRESAERFRQFGEASSDLLWIRNADTLAFEYLSPAFAKLYGVPRERVLERNHVDAWLELIHPDDRDAAIVALRKLREAIPSIHEFRIIRPDGTIRWIQNTDFPMLDEHGKVQRIAGIAADTTEEKHAVEMQATLLAELQHRVRNTLAVVRSIARRTAENSKSAEDLLAHFQGRLDAFSRVQSAVTRSADGSVDLVSLIEDELVAHAARGDGQVRIRGPEVSLDTMTAERLSLAIHELATNAVKHGALISDQGKIAIDWKEEPRNGSKDLIFTWSESGVEVDVERVRQDGFGMELLRRSLPYDLQAETSVDLRPAGLHFRLRMPLPHP